MFLKVIGYITLISFIPLAYFAVRKHERLKNGTQYAGIVTDLIRRRSSKGGPVYAIQVEYQDSSGGRKFFVNEYASNPPIRLVGNVVKVVEYRDGRNPDVLVFTSLYVFYWMWFCVILLVAGVFAGQTVIDWIYAK